ncbi:MAG: LacI family DNA-binding transcriptional regulator [Anaerolineae bacterium]|nr:LacI family DNA-binding transcriptional regulator [Anaerolineae bacterium]
MTSSRVTLKEIAHLAGVSMQTVSRVINNAPDVSEETRQRIENLIEQLGYHPNFVARNLVKQSSNNIGVMVSSLEYTGPNLFLAGIERQSTEFGYSLILSIMDEPIPKDLEKPVRSLLSHQVSGILWVVPEFGDNYAWWRKPERARLLQSVPIVFVNARPTEGLTVVGTDDRHGAYLITRHLLEQGYENIGIITGSSDGWDSQQRFAGWREALTERGIAITENQIAVGNWSAASGDAGLRRLMNQYPQMDALFVSSDEMALGALHAAAELGIAVPEKLAIAGFDDFPPTAYYTPSLTTARRNHIETGKLAMRELHRRIQARRDGTFIEASSILLQPQLVIRDSTPPKQTREHST